MIEDHPGESTTSVETVATLAPLVSAAWTTGTAELERLRMTIERSRRFIDRPADRAKAVHALLEAEAQAYNFAVAPRLSVPRISSATAWQTEHYAIGMPCQDFVYSTIFLDSGRDYRLSGCVGAARIFIVQLYCGLPGTPNAERLGEIDLSGHEGDFEMTVGGGPIADLRFDTGTRSHWMLVRRGVIGEPGALHPMRIEPQNDVAADVDHADDLEEAAVAGRLDTATNLLRFLIEGWVIGRHDALLDEASGRTNHFVAVPGALGDLLGASAFSYAGACFEHAADEALVVTLPRMENGGYWSVQLGDVWSRALDFRTRQSGLNDRQVIPDADGSTRLVIASSDPGVANWLDSCGRSAGTILLSRYGAPIDTLPSIARVTREALREVLPEGTALLSSEARSASLQARRDAFWEFYNR